MIRNRDQVDDYHEKTMRQTENRKLAKQRRDKMKQG